MSRPVDDVLAALNAEALLREWYEWWQRDDSAPVKMPEALHVRTAMYFKLRELQAEGVPL